MEEAILFAVKIDQTEAIKQTAELTAEIDTLVAKQKELDVAGQKNTETYAENAALIRSLKKEQQDVNRAIDNSTKAFKEANGSINQQRANLSLLTQEYNKLSKEERENENVGGKLQKQIKGLSDELKKNESAIGDNRRNVGGYQMAIEGAAKSLNLFGVDMTALKEGLEKSKAGFQIAKAGFGSLDKVIKASALGVVILLITGLIAAFAKFEPYMDKLEAAFAGLNAIVDVFVERLTRIGRGIGAIINGDFEEGLNMINTAFVGMADSMADAAKEAYELQTALQDLEDRQRSQIVTNAEVNKQIDQYLLKAKNRSLSDKERLGLLDKAGRLERKNFEQNKKIAEDEFNILLKQAKLKTQLSEQEIQELLTNTNRREELEKRIGTLSGNELTALAEKKAAIIQTESETINVEEKIANRRATLLESIEADREKAEQNRVKAEQELQKQFDEVLKQFDDKSKEATKQYYDNLAQQRAKDAAANKQYFDQKQNDLVNAYINETITTQQYEDGLLAIEVESLEKQKAELEKNLEDTTAIELEIAKQKLTIKKKTEQQVINSNKAEKESYDALAQTAQSSINALAQVFADSSDLQKAAALTGVAVNLATSLGNIVTTSTAPSPDNLATGGIAGVIKYGALLAQVLSAFAQVKSIIGGAAAGGGTFYTNGPTMLLVGDNPNGRERVTVEPIETRGKTSISRNSGLVKMAGGGTLITDGGASVNAMTSQVNSVLDMESMLRNLPTPVVKVTDINRVQNNVSKSVKVSELN